MPLCLNAQQGQEMKYKTIIKTLNLLQIGDLASQMSIQGCEDISVCGCIKCNLTKAEL